MVLIGSDQDTHADLKRQRGSGLPALSILVAPNPDAIAASYILTLILKREDIPFLLRPTKGYEDLCAIAREELAKEETRALFLINCGATVDLARLLGLEETNVQVFVLDSHRPYNLRNIFHKQIWLIDDGMTDTTNLPRLEDMLNDPYFEEEEEDENEEDEDKAYSDDEMMDESHPSYGERMKKREYKKRMLNSRPLQSKSQNHPAHAWKRTITPMKRRKGSPMVLRWPVSSSK